ncbi:hypothetical protein SAMN05192575_101435 [Nocardioides alpinus]|uniref:Uncharacterized protein n=1 Tax=Nocardioides alpinus TaxID=748909 RepID=A0A1I0VTR8_9ACTN|nr:hypothetical protein [Nocardioides alpinus]PKH37456.1 hypothetical protein CXG46_18580 [Nocardioides alpinus]SFA79427.1 hypothetical protein SAMN05192575_101435 [Nocardioides alpinus]
MTLSDLLAAAWRFKVIVAVGMVFTAAAGFLAIQDRTVFWTRAEVVFLVPQNEFHPDRLAASESVIITAGAVAKSVLGPDPVPKYASPGATLVGAGVREGWSIGLPDSGGQWGTNFDSQVLAIEAVGPTREWVLDTVEELREEVRQSLQALQDDAGVSLDNRISLKASPAQPVIYGVGGSRPRALLMTMLLGGGLTLALVSVLEVRRTRRESDPVPELVGAAAG